MGTDVRRGTQRFVTRREGMVTRHSFSAGQHHDPDNLHLGPLVAHDDHLLAPHRGFPPHRHSDLEIVTWVVSGALRHDGTATVRPGEAVVQSAGSGVVHSEEAAEAETRVVQAWLLPDRPGGAPRRTVAAVDPAPGRLTPVVGPEAPLRVGVAGARLDAVRLEDGGSVTLPASALQHAFVVSGSVGWEEEELTAGDAVRATGAPAHRITARGRALVLVWRFEGRQRHPSGRDR